VLGGRFQFVFRQGKLRGEVGQIVLEVTPLLTFAFPNADALAMEPVGQVAGTASAVFGALQAVAGAILGWLVAQSFDGTLRPVLASF
jgi:DHA1 family bicyclomycin/chloramphenicol resistance-like MFS transporter